MTPPDVQVVPDPEEQARTQFTEWQRFLSRIWVSSAGGKIGLGLLYAAFALPFVFNLAVIVFVWWIWPISAGVAEKMAILGFLFLVLNAIALQIRGTANSILTVAFLTRRRRRKRTEKQAERQ